MSASGHTSSALLDSDDAVEPEPGPRLLVSIVHEPADWSAFVRPEDAVRAAAAALVRHRRCAEAHGREAGIVLAGDDMVRGLNATYRRKDAPTNVLSFPFQPPAGAGPEDVGYLGDVVLAAETILRESREQGVTPTAHLQHLVVHGLLHLLGFDHGTDAEAEDMERLEVEILATLGIADPYAGPAA
jgi:probable rRNA maturation factor